MSLTTRIKVIQKKILDNYGKIKRLYTLTDPEGLIKIEYKGTILENGRIIDEGIPCVTGLTVKEFVKNYGGDEEADPQIEINFKGTTTDMLNAILKEVEK